jgi:cytochrome c oxidase assembly protein subunit 15
MSTMRTLHQRAFTVTVIWTLVLLFLGSIVHATESSLACPDWPTCFGTMVPEMSGGVFWEHLHRLVAGGLLLMWGLTTWLVRRETRDHPWIFKACVAGLALLFLCLATALASWSSWSRDVGSVSPDTSAGARKWGGAAAILVFVQCVMGGLVRHMDAGMACPDAPLCLGALVPPLDNALIAVHFAHRVVGVLAAAAVVGLATWAMRAEAPRAVRSWASWAAVLALVQVGLGFVSVLTTLAVVPVSLHTLVAASLLATLVHVTTLGWVGAEVADTTTVAA